MNDLEEIGRGREMNKKLYIGVEKKNDLHDVSIPLLFLLSNAHTCKIRASVAKLFFFCILTRRIRIISNF